MGPRKRKFNRIRHVANTIEPSVCDGDVALCLITLITCFDFYTISALIKKMKATFLYNLANSQNELYELFSFVAQEKN